MLPSASSPQSSEEEGEEEKEFAAALTKGSGKGAGVVWSDQVDHTQLAGEEEDDPDAHRPKGILKKGILKKNPEEGFQKLQEAVKAEPTTGQERTEMQRSIASEVYAAVRQIIAAPWNWNKGKVDEQGNWVPEVPAAAEGQTSQSSTDQPPGTSAAVEGQTGQGSTDKAPAD